MVFFTRARCRAAAAVVALVGDARRGYLSRDGDGCGHGSRLRRQRSFEPRQRCCFAETLCGLQLSSTGGDRSPALIPENTLREYFLPRLARL